LSVTPFETNPIARKYLVKIFGRRPHLLPRFKKMLNHDGEDDVERALLRKDHRLQVDLQRRYVLSDVQSVNDQPRTNVIKLFFLCH
jgi:hypothetical protein